MRAGRLVAGERGLTQASGGRRGVAPAAVLQTHGGERALGVGPVALVAAVAHLAAHGVPASLEGAVAHGLGESTGDGCRDTPREPLPPPLKRIHGGLCKRCATKRGRLPANGRQPRPIVTMATLPETSAILFAGREIHPATLWIHNSGRAGALLNSSI